MKFFQKVVTDCSLFDLGYRGGKYTYSNRRKGARECKSRLDRVLVSQDWLHEYPEAINTHMFTYSSDHKALCLQLRSRQNSRTKVFRFENMWFQEESFQQIINTAWQNYSHSQSSFEDKLMLLQKHLTSWNPSKFGNVQAKIKDLKAKLEGISGQERTELSIQQEHQLISDLDDWLHREEILWRQRSRALWLDDGDNNTKYFHAYASSRKKLNSITRLFDGTVQSHRSAPYTDQEITRAVFQLHPMKAPGKDGFNAAFYQVCWPIIKNDFIKDCLKFLNDGFLNSEANVTLISLIPKVKGATRVSDFRPISLIGTKMKVISKVIVNRLQQILNEVVSPEQCAFVPNRLITDNLLISHEVIHYIRGVTTGRRRVYGSLKLDIAKAYDTVDWVFLENVLLKLGFTEVWVHRVMQLVTSVTYSVRVNESYSDIIVPRRGIRQGYPLSTYLFILCTEYFTALLSKYKGLWLIEGIKISQRAPAVSHLLFADDSLLFFRVTQSSISWIRTILTIYGKVTGLHVNFEKSEIMLSKNASPEFIDHIRQLMGVKVVQSHTKYLGLPTVVSRCRTQTMQGIIDKMRNKTRSWQSVMLSQGGRQVLIQSVLHAIPQYWLSCFLLPEKVINQIHSMINNFWWCHSGKNKGVHWIKGDTLRLPKDEGGLGFYNFKYLNLAFLAKQCWRMLQAPDSLVGKLFKAKYFSNCHLIDAPLTAKPSHVWRALHEALPILRFGCCVNEETNELIWKMNSSGNLDIKSAYKTLHLIYDSNKTRGEQSDKQDEKAI
ncbi:hypothetical protein QQ045_001345 [Rhodiola kirilowii]